MSTFFLWDQGAGLASVEVDTKKLDITSMSLAIEISLNKIIAKLPVLKKILSNSGPDDPRYIKRIVVQKHKESRSMATRIRS